MFTPQIIVIVVSVLIVGVCAALGAGSIMTAKTLGDLEDHCTSAGDCDADVVKQLPYDKKWMTFFSAAFLSIGGIAAIAAVAAGIMIYYKSRAAPLAAAGAAEALKEL
jgi:hypothetical protein